mgnify:CR=1 FL=1
MEPHFVNVNTFAAKYKSKREVYTFLTIDGNAYLSAFDTLTVYFLKDLVSGQAYLAPLGLTISVEGATIRELFRLFNKERGGTLSQAHYARFCQLTEGQGCDDARWAQHCRAYGHISDGRR